MTDKQIDTLKLAREALEYISSHYMSLPKIGCMALAAVEEALAEQPAQQEPEPDRVKFERHWRKTRGDKKANRELPRHPLQPQTYIQDSANRHWVTWQAAVRSVSPQPAQQQEPVAWMYQCSADSSGPVLMQHKRDWAESGSGLWTETPLYTSPQPSKPLTDEEIWKFWWSRPEVPDGEDDSMEAEFVAAVRRVLAAHGIKGEA